MKLKVITSNPGKVAEYQKAFDELGIEMEHYRLPYDEVQTSDLEEVVNKGMDEIIGNISPTADVIGIIRPVYNFKAGDTRPEKQPDENQTDENQTDENQSDENQTDD